ncbi:hypothetical protein [Streptomyces olindensis]|uniref:hypothetical protein n=1 Tax=Streptomyces olindensis TaxID=358823 RepID=UPI0033CB3553
MTHLAAALGGVFIGVMIGIIGSGARENDSPNSVRTETALPSVVEQNEKGGTKSPDRPQTQQSAGIPGETLEEDRPVPQP